MSKCAANKVYVFCYREWAFQLIVDLKSYHELTNSFHIFVPEEMKSLAELYQTDKDVWLSNRKLYTYSVVDPKNIGPATLEIPPGSLFLFYGWSWMVPADIVDKHTCICLHPSPLPKYRGGSPIQNQVLAGEKTSAVTLFRMTQGLDNGPVYKQAYFDLAGDLNDILQEIINNGCWLTYQLVKDYDGGRLVFFEQNHGEATYCKRRKPAESEVFLSDSVEMIKRKVACMQPPYPQTFIRLNSGEKLFLKAVSSEETSEEKKEII